MNAEIALTCFFSVGWTHIWEEGHSRVASKAWHKPLDKWESLQSKILRPNYSAADCPSFSPSWALKSKANLFSEAWDYNSWIVAQEWSVFECPRQAALLDWLMWWWAWCLFGMPLNTSMNMDMSDWDILYGKLKCFLRSTKQMLCQADSCNQVPTSNSYHLCFDQAKVASCWLCGETEPRWQSALDPSAGRVQQCAGRFASPGAAFRLLCTCAVQQGMQDVLGPWHRWRWLDVVHVPKAWWLQMAMFAVISVFAKALRPRHERSSYLSYC